MTSGKVLIIGGGPAGLEAARCVAELGGEAILIEKRERLGGTPDRENYAKLTHHWRDASEAMAELSASVTGNPNVEVKYQAEVRSLSGDEGDFEVQIESGGVAESINIGAVIVATGFQHFDPGRATQYYNYYSFPDVITLTDLEKMLRDHNVVRPSNGEVP
ncbi:MAG TPA: FAD-dependent oxidoreductase, partial [Anaerolineales bacterium]|nr:FAD-dependent oxidoreductase [Anaerolineales bacterium]